MLTTILYIILAIVVLLILITVHEFGHYLAGKMLGFKINEFSIGFGKHTIFQKINKKGEKFSIRLIPLGGYCAFEGEDEDNPNNPEAFNNQKPWKRLIVTLAGVFFNFLFGVLTAAIFLMCTQYAIPQVYQLAPGNTYLQEGDIIRAINGKDLEIYRHMSDVTANYGEGEEFVITIERDGEIIDITIAKQNYQAFYYVANEAGIINNLYDVGGNPVSSQDFKEIIMSITPTKAEDGSYEKPQITSVYAYYYKNDAGELVAYTNDEIIEKAMITLAPEGVSLGFVYSNYAQRYGFFESILKAWPFSFYICGVMLSALAGIFTGATQLKDLGGTVTAIGQIAEVSQMGFTQFLMLFPLLSLNLALFNILPIPALDGARAVFILIEMIFRKPVPRKIEGYIHMVGLILLFALVIFLDVYHFFFVWFNWP